MRAAILREANTPLNVEDVELDRPGPHEVLVRTVASGVCHSDLHVVDGHMPLSFFGPDITAIALGHEGAGIVEAVGDAVTYVQPGDHVVACLSSFCGQCESCLTGHPNRCRWTSKVATRPEGEPPRLSQDGEPVHQFLDLASFAEQMLLHESSIVKIADDVPLELAALLSCGVMTGVGAALRTARVEPGSTVAVFGCGGVGLSVIQGSQIAGARQIIAVDIFDTKLEMAKELGATHTVHARNQDPVEAILELTGGVEYSFDAIGSVAVTRQAVEILRHGGTATMVGTMSPNDTLELRANSLWMEKKLQNTHMGSNRFRVDIPLYLEFYRQGKLRLDKLVTHRLPLEDVNEAFRLMQSGESARSVLVFD